MSTINVRLLLAFFAIYVVWGSTYLAIREAVATIPPLLTAGVRHLVAGAVLYVWARGWNARISAAEWRASLVVAVLFFLIGHGTLHWAERFVASGIAALLVATEPIWIAMLMPPAGGPRWSARTIGGLTAGLAGVALLVPREELAQGSQQAGVGPPSSSALCRGPSACATRRPPSCRGTRSCARRPRCCAAPCCSSRRAPRSARLRGCDPSAISARSALGLLYLIFFGSVVAFSAYTWLLERCSATLVATHTYVNPVIAVLLGWLFAGELLTPRIVGATGLILAAVVLLKADSTKRTADQRDEPCSATARAGAD